MAAAMGQITPLNNIFIETGNLTSKEFIPDDTQKEHRLI